MITLKTLFVFMFILISPSWSLTGYEKKLDSPLLKPSQADLELAESIKKVLSSSEEKFKNKKTLLDIQTKIKKNSHFSVYHFWIKDLILIQETKTISDLIPLCREFKKNLKKPPLLKALQIHSLNECRRMVLNFISLIKLDKSEDLKLLFTEFITAHLKYLIKGPAQSHFISALQSMRDQEIHQKIISPLIEKYIMENNIQVSFDFLSSLTLSAQFSRWLQNKGLVSNRIIDNTRAEWTKMIEASYRSMDGSLSDEEVKQKLQAILKFYHGHEELMGMNYITTKLNDLSKAYQRNGYPQLANEIFPITSLSSNIEIKEDAQFYRAWTWFQKEEYDQALEHLKKHDLISNWQTIKDARFKFWIAYSILKTSKSNLAQDILESIILNHPLSIYAIFSTKLLKTHFPKSIAIQFYTNIALNPPSPLSEDQFNHTLIDSLKRLKIWSQLDDKAMILRESRYLLENLTQNKNLDHFYPLAAAVVGRSNNYLEAFKIIYRGFENKSLNLNRLVIEALYPSPYLDLLQKSFDQSNIDPLIPLSLMRQESVFNKVAFSSAGARGLMQIMLPTARLVRRSTKAQDLFKPEINIAIGSLYFKQLMRKYDQNLVYVFSAYNAGEARVKRWKELYFNSDSIIHNMEAVPFLETRNYSKLIFRNLFFYKLLSKEKLTDEAELNKIFNIDLGFTR